MGEHSVRADIAKNRLYITLNGFFTDQEVRTAADRVIQEAGRLRPGFGVINDICSFKPATANGAEELKRAQLGLKQRGVGRVIRIVGAAAVASMQLARQSKEAGYSADTAATVKDAEAMLSK